jgi:hypothetical protein
VRELEDLASTAVRARGHARAAIVEKLAELDAILIAATIGQTAAPDAERLRAEARDELAPFSTRMPAAARQAAEAAAFRRLVREAAHLPTIAYE